MQGAGVCKEQVPWPGAYDEPLFVDCCTSMFDGPDLTRVGLAIKPFDIDVFTMVDNRPSLDATQQKNQSTPLLQVKTLSTQPYVRPYLSPQCLTVEPPLLGDDSEARVGFIKPALRSKKASFCWTTTCSTSQIAPWLRTWRTDNVLVGAKFEPSCNNALVVPG